MLEDLPQPSAERLALVALMQALDLRDMQLPADEHAIEGGQPDR